MSLCLYECNVVAHFDLITCHFLQSCSMTWCGLHCLSFIYSFITWYALSSFYLLMDYIAYLSSILSWLDMNCLVSIFLFHDLIWIILFIFYLSFHDLIWITMACIFLPWLDMDLSSSFISFSCVNNMFPIRFLWFILG